MRDEGTRLVDKAQAVQDHRLHGMPCGHKTHFRVLLGGFLNDLSDAEFVKHPCDQAAVIYHLTVGGLWHELSS
jgi:hypothetical protein